jgi:hypothetical protein
LGGYNNEHINAGTYIVYGLIFLFLLVCGLSLCRQLYRQKIWPRFVVIYLVLFLSLLLSWLMFTQTDFHLHHTMLGIILVPFTRFTNPLATAGQAAALGCFIQGYAAWGWSAYLSTRRKFVSSKLLYKL